MILVFGGTTEGNQVITELTALEKAFVYSTKTKIEVDLPDFAQYRFGALTEEGLSDFVKNHNIDVIINASHPFALELHQTVAAVGIKVNIPVFRFERSYPTRIKSERIRYVNTYADALDYLATTLKGRRGLILTGVQSIAKLKPFWCETPCFFRIIDRESSITIARESNFPVEQLILEHPKKMIGGEEQLIASLGIQFMVTKESGSSGALSNKINVALNAGIPLVILKRPSLPDSFIVFKQLDELTVLLQFHHENGKVFKR